MEQQDLYLWLSVYNIILKKKAQEFMDYISAPELAKNGALKLCEENCILHRELFNQKFGLFQITQRHPLTEA